MHAHARAHTHASERLSVEASTHGAQADALVARASAETGPRAAELASSADEHRRAEADARRRSGAERASAEACRLQAMRAFHHSQQLAHSIADVNASTDVLAGVLAAADASGGTGTGSIDVSRSLDSASSWDAGTGSSTQQQQQQMLQQQQQSAAPPALHAANRLRASAPAGGADLSAVAADRYSGGVGGHRAQQHQAGGGGGGGPVARSSAAAGGGYAGTGSEDRALTNVTPRPSLGIWMSGGRRSRSPDLPDLPGAAAAVAAARRAREAAADSTRTTRLIPVL
ncbi:hypothetical protein FOA52_001473 [Chlamydomonas sp. UWO 241]|nr:hypothetical protein FOA52_001473 [Chlamydomonas sp. UWO 241]